MRHVENLPWNKVDRIIGGEPHEVAVGTLDDINVINNLNVLYSDDEDVAKALTGALLGYRIYEHIMTAGLEELQIWKGEVLIAYESYAKDVRGPFFNGLKKTLEALKLEKFYVNCINYIIDNKGSVDDASVEEL